MKNNILIVEDHELTRFGLKTAFEACDFIENIFEAESAETAFDIIDDNQIGKKIGKHAKDFGLNPSLAKDRKKFQDIIYKIFNFYDEIRVGGWRGQKDDVLFYIKENDVVITKLDGTYITTLKDGVSNERVKNARKRKI